MAIVQLEDVHKKYPLGKTEVHAVRGVSFEIQRGDFISIAGPSGSGKSTILNLIGCIDVPTDGRVVLNDTDTKGLKDKEITSLRHRFIGFIFQSFNLVPVLNVYENIEFPLLLGREKVKVKEKKEWIDYLIDEVGLSQWRNHRPNELSGGQRQRVAIARAVVKKPALVLADEPTANLDAENSHNILRAMVHLNQELGTTYLFSTHDEKVINYLRRKITLLDGKIVSDETMTPQGRLT